MKQGFLFPDDTTQGDLFPDDDAHCAALLYIPQSDVDGSEWGDFDSCLTEFGTNRCTLDGKPARVIGTPRTARYASIEPIDLDAEPICCCWDVVDMVMQDPLNATGSPPAKRISSGRRTPTIRWHSRGQPRPAD